MLLMLVWQMLLPMILDNLCWLWQMLLPVADVYATVFIIHVGRCYCLVADGIPTWVWMADVIAKVADG